MQKGVASCFPQKASSRCMHSDLLSKSCTSQLQVGQRVVSGQKQQTIFILINGGKKGKDAHLTLFLLELYLDVSELGPELFIGSLQGSQGVQLLPPSSAAGALLGHDEAARQRGESSPEALVPALARGFSSLPPSHYIFLLAWKEGNHITTVRVLEVGR